MSDRMMNTMVLDLLRYLKIVAVQSEDFFGRRLIDSIISSKLLPFVCIQIGLSLVLSHGSMENESIFPEASSKPFTSMSRSNQCRISKACQGYLNIWAYDLTSQDVQNCMTI